MESRMLGSTGLVVSRMGLGLAALGRPGYINLGHAADLDGKNEVAAMEFRAHSVLDSAWAAGVRYFDAARSYGRAEEFLASWLALRKSAPGDAIVGSKWGYTYTAGWQIKAVQQEVKDHSLAALLRQEAESRKILGRHLNLYQIHSATLESGVLDNRAVGEELARLRSTGMRVGLTLSGPRQAETLKRALDCEVGGERLFDCVQATWNLLDRSVGSTLAAARAAGFGVIIKEALANGRLTGRNADPAFAPKQRILEETSLRLKTTPDGLALAAVLDQPWVDVVLSGATTIDQLHSNLAALTVMWDTQVGSMLPSLTESPEEYWQTRARLAWN